MYKKLRFKFQHSYLMRVLAMAKKLVKFGTPEINVTTPDCMLLPIFSPRSVNARYSGRIRVPSVSCFKNNFFFFCDTSESMDEDYVQPIYTRTEAITEEDDKSLAGATKEYRNELQIIIPENPFPEIEVDAYPPLKFSWVIPKKLAAMAFPRNKENVKFIVNQGITHLITLTADKKPPVDGVARLNVSDIPIEEFGVPDLEQVKKFIDICKRADKSGEVIGLHCRQGRTRCGVMLACYLIHFHRFEPDQAMDVVRSMRPGSCDSEDAEEAVGRYFAYLTEDNPLRFGVSGELMEEWVETARSATKKALGEL